MGWETNVPKGAQLHVATFADDGLHVLDIWDSAEDFQAFLEKRLMPAVQEIGIQGQPVVSISPLHATFNTPNYKPR